MSRELHEALERAISRLRVTAAILKADGRDGASILNLMAADELQAEVVAFLREEVK